MENNKKKPKIIGQREGLSAQTHRVPVAWPVLHGNNKCTGKVHGYKVLLKSPLYHINYELADIRLLGHVTNQSAMGNEPSIADGVAIGFSSKN